MQSSVPHFDQVYTDYAERIYRFIYYRTHHKETAEDLAQVTFMKALDKWEQYNTEKGPIGAWLYQIARNVVVDHYRSFKPTGDIEDVFDLSSDEDFVSDLKNDENAERVRKALAGLKAPQRDLILMRVWDELSFKEIAALLGKTEASLKMTFYRSLTDLRDQLALLILFLLLLYSLQSTVLHG